MRVTSRLLRLSPQANRLKREDDEREHSGDRVRDDDRPLTGRNPIHEPQEHANGEKDVHAKRDARGIARSHGFYRLGKKRKGREGCGEIADDGKEHFGFSFDRTEGSSLVKKSRDRAFVDRGQYAILLYFFQGTINLTRPCGGYKYRRTRREGG